MNAALYEESFRHYLHIAGADFIVYLMRTKWRMAVNLDWGFDEEVV